MVAILFKLLVALGTGALGACALRMRAIERLSDRGFIVAALGLQLLPAILLFVALYIVAGQEVTSDVPAYYVPPARAVLAGQVPYRDFPLSYAPLFPYIGAGLLKIWNSPNVFALFGMLLNAVTLVLWHRAASLVYGRDTARASSVLYAASGHALIQVLLGTNQIWIGAALAASALLLIKGHSAASGFVQALALCTVKILTLLFWPVLWMMAPARLRWLCAAVLGGAVVYGAFVAEGANVLAPLLREGDLISPGNVPYLLGPLLSGLEHSGARVFDVIMLLLLGVAVLWLFRRKQRQPEAMRDLAPALALIGLLFMLTSKKSFGGYSLFFLFPLLLALVMEVREWRWRCLFFTAFNALVAVESSVWFYLGGNGKTLAQWLAESASKAAAFVPLDIALVACYAYLAVLCVRRLRAS